MQYRELDNPSPYNLNLQNADTKWRMKPHGHINRKPDFRNIFNGYDNLVQQRMKGSLSSESLLGQFIVHNSSRCFNRLSLVIDYIREEAYSIKKISNQEVR